jgi:hypothetical protein
VSVNVYEGEIHLADEEIDFTEQMKKEVMLSCEHVL